MHRLLITIATRVSWASTPPLTQAQRQDRHDLVPVDIRAPAVHGKTAVGVATQVDQPYVAGRLSRGSLRRSPNVLYEAGKKAFHAKGEIVGSVLGPASAP
jgi:hypothetical protein